MIKLINQTITLSKEVQVKVTLHAKQFADSRVYLDSSQSVKDKIQRDAYSGKLAEFAVYERLTDLGYNCSEPDLEIYPQKDRTWKPDLRLTVGKETRNVHVKCSPNKSKSWVFQADFAGRYDKEIFDNQNKTDIIYLTETTFDVNIIIYCIMDIQQALALMKLPRLRKLYGNKLCIYKEDIKLNETRS